MITIALSLMIYPFPFGEAVVATRSPFSPYYNPANRPRIDYYSITFSTSRIGGVEYLSLDRSFKGFTCGVAASDSVWNQKSWLSASTNIRHLDLGLGLGLDRSVRPIVMAGGLFESRSISIGLSYRYGLVKTIQGGLGLGHKWWRSGFEIERSLFEDSSKTYLHFGFGYDVSEAVVIQGGYYQGIGIGVSTAVGPLLFFFGLDRINFEHCRIHFGIYSIIREKIIKKTITRIRVKEVPVVKKVYVPVEKRKKKKEEVKERK
ncbi:MAG TPA: hypothetical protein EYP24_05695, partial [bacterium (Candidatus Stahlbacteria)]|nr:hypothetical protein [Candidatus Stahlbacteria bacterium]